MNPVPTVFLIDDDPAVREGLALLLDSAGLMAEAFPEGQSFLDAVDEHRPGCAVLDLRMPGMGGLALQRELLGRGYGLPIIFLSAFGDVPTTVSAIKDGAFDFLTKPVDGRQFLRRVQEALTLDAWQRQTDADARLARRRLDSLTTRETEVLAMVVQGQSSKEIARRLALSYRTVEVYRARILHKTGAANLVELVRMVVERDG